MNQHIWDLYFMRIAREVSKNSKCLSRKIGAVLVKDNAIISTGYNGAPRGIKHCQDRTLDFYVILDNKEHQEVFAMRNICPRREFSYKSGEGLHLCQAGHAERNALIQAGRNGISTYGTTLYCYCGQVCKECCIEIINAGVRELIFLDGLLEYDKYSGILLEESGIEVRKLEEGEL